MPKPNAIKPKIIMDRVVPPVLKTRLASKLTIAFPALECLGGIPVLVVSISVLAEFD